MGEQRPTWIEAHYGLFADALMVSAIIIMLVSLVVHDFVVLYASILVLSGSVLMSLVYAYDGDIRLSDFLIAMSILFMMAVVGILIRNLLVGGIAAIFMLAVIGYVTAVRSGYFKKYYNLDD